MSDVKLEPTSELDFQAKIVASRLNVGPSISDFTFNKKRVKILSDERDVPEHSKGIVYWMSRDQRVEDNWALLYAQKLALKTNAPLHVCFCLVPTFLEATLRQFKFMLAGLQEVEAELKSKNISFHLLIGKAPDVLPQFVTNNSIGALVTDFSPVRLIKSWVNTLKERLPSDVPFLLVDAHNIVPCWVTSDKQEWAARTIRNKINSKLGEFLTHFPPVVIHPHLPIAKPEKIDWKAAEESLKCDRTVDEVSWAIPGTKGGLIILQTFCEKKLKTYNASRNNPTKDGLSNLGPWFHFGQIAPQRAILCVRQYSGKQYKESVDAFCEETIVRRELSDNFCYYNEKYDVLDGGPDWAKKSLALHAKDKRKPLYNQSELEKAATYDKLWNATQNQLIRDGKIHGYMRMYWAKKILEWTETPEEALRISIWLNDRYSIDGRDPNGYVGCMWSVCGVHDQGWKERPIFGKIRYMNYEGCKRKFDVAAYERKYR